MKHFTYLVLLGILSLVLLATACAPASPLAGTPRAPTGAATGHGNPANGSKAFAGTCASCHGKDAKGLPNLGKNLTTSAFVKSLNDAQLLAFVKKGRPASDPANTTGVDMPPKGGNPALNDASLTDIIAFIRTVNK